MSWVILNPRSLNFSQGIISILQNHDFFPLNYVHIWQVSSRLSACSWLSLNSRGRRPVFVFHLAVCICKITSDNELIRADKAFVLADIMGNNWPRKVIDGSISSDFFSALLICLLIWVNIWGKISFLCKNNTSKLLKITTPWYAKYIIKFTIPEAFFNDKNINEPAVYHCCKYQQWVFSC